MIRIMLISLLSLSVLTAQTGADIARMIDDRTEPADVANDMTMTLTAKNGNSRTFTIHTVRKGENFMILWFLAPADDRGVALLTIEHDNGDTEMRMWLPSFRRMRRIASSKRGDSFMGSDLSFEDLTSRSLDDYTHNLLGEETINGEPYWLLENVPNADLRSSYSRIVSKVRQSDALVLWESYYDRAGDLLKERTVEFTDLGGYTLPVKMVVTNVQKGHSTKLLFENMEVDTGVDEGLFHERNLKKLP